MEKHSYLLGDHDLQFWVEGLVMMVLIVLIVKAFRTDKHHYTGRFWKNVFDWLDHNKKDLFLSTAIPYIGVLAVEWTEPLLSAYTKIKLPHTDNDFLWFIPLTAFVAYKLHDKFHKH